MDLAQSYLGTLIHNQYTTCRNELYTLLLQKRIRKRLQLALQSYQMRISFPDNFYEVLSRFQTNSTINFCSFRSNDFYPECIGRSFPNCDSLGHLQMIHQHEWENKSADELIALLLQV